MEKRSQKRIEAAKKKARAELVDEAAWQQFQYHKNFTHTVEEIKARDTLERIQYEQYTEKEFIDKYESQRRPCVIQGAQDTWKATENWRPEVLAKKYRNQAFKCGTDDDGKPVRMKMKYFVEYCNSSLDDSPLYMFESKYGAHAKKKKLLLDYNIPKYFRDDLLQYAGEEKRPPYRWFVMGPPRSGTGIHIDPLGTSAWNALVHGHKWWCMFPNDTPKELLVLTDEEAGKHKREGITWFTTVYPRTQQPDWPEKYKPIEALQGPGEIMFVPGGWWHVVVNIDLTVAVTQNFCSVTNFPTVWHKAKQKRPMLAKRWLRQLSHHRTEMSGVAGGLDTSGPPPILSDTSSGSDSSASSAISTDYEADSDPDSPFMDSGDEASPGASYALTSLLAIGMKRRQERATCPDSDEETPNTRTADPIKYTR